jgi:hypothetical protein
MTGRQIDPALPGVDSVILTTGLGAEMAGLKTSEVTPKPAAPARSALRDGNSDAGLRASPMVMVFLS